MIHHPAFAVEPWAVRETELDLDALAQTESVFALVERAHRAARQPRRGRAVRACPAPTWPASTSVRPLPYAEAGLRLPRGRPDGRQRDQRQDHPPAGRRRAVRRALRRAAPATSGCSTSAPACCAAASSGSRRPDGRSASPRPGWSRSRSARSRRSCTRSSRSTSDCPVVVQSELVANEPLPSAERGPAGGGGARGAAARPSSSPATTSARSLVHRTKVSGLRLAAAMDHLIDGPDGTETTSRERADLARLTITADVAPGRAAADRQVPRLRLVGQRSFAALRDQVAAALAGAAHTGWDGLSGPAARLPGRLLGARRRRARRRRRAPAGGALRALSHAPGGRARRAARDRRQGPDRPRLRRPHVLGHRDVRAARPDLHRAARRRRCAALAPRRRSTSRASGRARSGSAGAAFPWRTIAGRSARATGRRARPRSTSTPTSPTPWCATRPRPRTRTFEREAGVELLVETARLWRSLGHHDADGRFRIDGVTGPDEYSAIADNNVYTNLMAQRNLRAAADAPNATRDARRSSASTRRRPRAGATPPTRSSSPSTSRSASTPRPRASPITRRGTSTRPRPSSTRCCCTSRTSTCTASRSSSRPTSCWRCSSAGRRSRAEEKARDFAYYEPMTVRDSSLSACTQAVVAAEVGHLELAYDYFAEAALMDLDDLEHNTRDGLHIASLAGACIAALAGFGGMRDHDGTLSFSPRLPVALTRLRFRLMFRGRACSSMSTTTTRPTRCSTASRSRSPTTVTRDGLSRQAADARDPSGQVARLAGAA